MRDLVDVRSGFEQLLYALQTVLPGGEHQRGNSAAVSVAGAAKCKIGGSGIGGGHNIFFLAIAGLGLLRLAATLLALARTATATLLALPEATSCLCRFRPLSNGGRQVRTIALGVEIRGCLVIRAARQQQLHRLRM